MGDLLESAKSALFTAIKIYLAITVVVFVFFGPQKAATWVLWTGDQIKNAVSSGETFTEEVSK